jgi:hypothetical protein
LDGQNHHQATELGGDDWRFSKPHLWELIALFGVFALLAIFVNRVIWNIDVFWHIAAGRAIIEYGGIPSTDIFSSIDPEREWITFQWGYQVLVYFLDKWGGLGLVRFTHAVLMWLGFFLFWWGCRHRLKLGRLTCFVLLLLLIVLFSDRIRARPHVFNFLAWSILFPAFVRGPRALNARDMLMMFTVVGVWANIHAGGALLFLIAAATLPFASLFAERLGRTTSHGTFRRASAWYAAGLIPALLSPHFLTGNVQAFVMLQRTEAVIGEWKPCWYFLEIASTPGHIVCGLLPLLALAFWVGISLSTALTKRSERRALWPFWRALLTLALIILSMRSVRFVYIVTFALILMLPVASNAWQQSTWGKDWHAKVAAVMVSALLLVFATHSNISCRFGGQCDSSFTEVVAQAFGTTHVDTQRFPTVEADVLQETQFKGSIFAQASWGGYLLYRLWPMVRVIADGRGNYDAEVAKDLEVVYDTRLLSDLRNGPAFETIYTRYHPDLVMQQHPWPVQTFESGNQPANGLFVGYDDAGNSLFHYMPHPKDWRPLTIQGKRPTIWLNMQSAASRSFYRHVYGTRGSVKKAIRRVH